MRPNQGIEALDVAQAAQVAPGPHEDLLGGVPSVGLVPHDRHRGPERRLQALDHQSVERVAIAGASSEDELGLERPWRRPQLNRHPVHRAPAEHGDTEVIMLIDVPKVEPWRVLSITPVPREAVEGWLRLIEGVELVHAEPRTQATVQALAPEAEIVLTDWSGTLRWTAAEVALAPKLAFVHSPSVGVDGIDLEACAAAGVPVTNPAGLNAQSVAEWCLAAAFAVARDLVGMDAGVRAGGWPGQEDGRRTVGELSGRRVGVLGFGAIGSQVARLFGALDCDVAYWTRTARKVTETAGASWLPLEALLAHAEILVVNLPRTPETVGLVDRDRLLRLPRRAIVVDASRGGIVDQDALCDLLEAGHLAGAAVDVYPQEPLPAGARIRRTERVLLSPHAASYTPQALAAMLGRVTENVARAVQGEPVLGVINGVDPVVRRR